jgi:DNA-directed RNA polymerase subunit M/transcription elongation factor TFIIS
MSESIASTPQQTPRSSTLTNESPTNNPLLISFIRQQCLEELCKIIPEKQDYFEELEGRIFDMNGQPNTLVQLHGYYRKYVQLVYNLKRFGNQLIQRYQPSELIFINSSDLNPEVKKELEKYKQQNEEYKNIQDLKLDDDEEEDTNDEGLMKCKVCKNNKNIGIMFRQLKSGDEPMSMFLTCGKCGFQWRKG